jgi:hypothetical protein
MFQADVIALLEFLRQKRLLQPQRKYGDARFRIVVVLDLLIKGLGIRLDFLREQPRQAENTHADFEAKAHVRLLSRN